MSKKRDEPLYSAMSVGERIRVTRISIGVTQRAFAFPLGQTRESVTMYESGTRHPHWEVAVQMCDAWGLTLDWIFRGDLSGLSPMLVEKINRNLHKARVRII
jgi:DNA-binding XRE family transcriptional regulator